MEKNFLEGNGIYLRNVQKEDYTEATLRWVNDSEVTKYLFRGIVPTTADDLLKEYELLKDNKNDVVLSICDKATNKVIGTTGLHSIQWIPRHAEFRVLIGEKAYWGKGYGKEVTMLMTAYGFERFNLNKVWLGVNAENQNAYQTYLKTNFKVEGEFRDDFFRNGRYYNVYRMSILKREYEEVKKTWEIYNIIKKQLLASE